MKELAPVKRMVLGENIYTVPKLASVRDFLSSAYPDISPTIFEDAGQILNRLSALCEPQIFDSIFDIFKGQYVGNIRGSEVARQVLGPPLGEKLPEKFDYAEQYIEPGDELAASVLQKIRSRIHDADFVMNWRAGTKPNQIIKSIQDVSQQLSTNVSVQTIKVPGNRLFKVRIQAGTQDFQLDIAADNGYNRQDLRFSKYSGASDLVCSSPLIMKESGVMVGTDEATIPTFLKNQKFFRVSSSKGPGMIQMQSALLREVLRVQRWPNAYCHPDKPISKKLLNLYHHSNFHPDSFLYEMRKKAPPESDDDRKFRVRENLILDILVWNSLDPFTFLLAGSDIIFHEIPLGDVIKNPENRIEVYSEMIKQFKEKQSVDIVNQIEIPSSPITEEDAFRMQTGLSALYHELVLENPQADVTMTGPMLLMNALEQTGLMQQSQYPLSEYVKLIDPTSKLPKR